ncbi:DUF221-domain-containing protein [Irpex rosettiformis]|uniref:DUF221-domain-containing protein n=1 Tax=Irpex rosettiformis TaxID=378272 RepID=A0ACB8UH63_9APHY|nr:DUF221-domain-containing protein [Irpex rosettiformis]
MSPYSYLLSAFPTFAAALDEDDGNPLPPGSPPTLTYDGPWFATQLTLSAAIGAISFLIFSYCRTRYPLLFAPRTKLKAFSPHEAHAHNAFFGWILPTIRVSEYAVLQIVGLDAAVLLNFFKMSFQLFSVCSVFAIIALMPINLKNNIDIGDGREDGDNPTEDFLAAPSTPGETPRERDWLDLISDANSYLSVHLLFTYLFTCLTLYFIHRNYQKFVKARQLFSLELVHSIAARTVMVTQLPKYLQSERTLADYFEAMDLSVESVNVCREVDSLKTLLDRRTKALLKLENAWVQYLGNPSRAAPLDSVTTDLINLDNGAIEEQRGRLVVPNRKRPTIRLGWFQRRVDALEYLEEEYKKADEEVKQKRHAGKFKSTHVAFVTFEKMSSAQIAVQTVHSNSPALAKTYQAPEPRDIVWSNMGVTPGGAMTREFIVLTAMVILFFFWFIPISMVAGLLSFKEIKKTWPALARLIDASPRVGAIVQNFLPSIAIITLNACLPFLLEGLTYIQGYRARSWIEYSLLKKYFLYLLVNVVFIFLFASTYWQLVRDLANSPAKIPEKLAAALQKGNARHFFVSYIILQVGIGLMPLQLLNLGVIIPRMFYRMFITRTPRDFAELNAPPMINYGVVYPQAILIFTMTLLYSIIQPLILIFGAVYFGVAYVVYKYKLLFVFYKPYESQGQAWPITFARLIWGVIIYLVFMSGIFILRKSFILSTLLVPLLGGVLIWAWYTDKKFKPLSKYVSLSSVFEVQRGADTADVARLRTGHPVTWSQSNLNHRRYAQNDETLYVAPEDERTDYSQPPMANWYTGVLNTGKRRYGHPALNGVLPQPWLPLKKGQSIQNGPPSAPPTSEVDTTPAVVLTLRKRYSITGRPKATDTTPTSNTQPAASTSDTPENPWKDAVSPTTERHKASQLHHRLSFDAASGVIMLPDDEDWLEESDSDEDYGVVRTKTNPVTQDNGDVETTPQGQSALPSPSGSKRYATYYHHPERRKRP